MTFRNFRRSVPGVVFEYFKYFGSKNAPGSVPPLRVRIGGVWALGPYCGALLGVLKSSLLVITVIN